MQTNNSFGKEYWNQRWISGQTGWDLGAVSPALKTYIDQLPDKTISILIPGCGNSWEAEYLQEQGFLNTHVIDISPAALESFRKRMPGFPAKQLHCCDFFEFKGIEFQLILEQTFFCALDPSLRPAYVQQMHQLLVPGGKLTGLLFEETGNTDQPPFGGSVDEYRRLFEPSFQILRLEKAYNSIPPRAGRELFMIMKKN